MTNTVKNILLDLRNKAVSGTPTIGMILRGEPGEALIPLGALVEVLYHYADYGVTSYEEFIREAEEILNVE